MQIFCLTPGKLRRGLSAWLVLGSVCSVRAQPSTGVSTMSSASASIFPGLATLRSQALDSLAAPTAAANINNAWATIFGRIRSASNATAPSSVFACAGDAKVPSFTGRNLALHDPESAYQMMSIINGNDVSYRAQFSELSQMQFCVSQMQKAGQSLLGIDVSSENQEIASRLQEFIG